MIIFAGPPSGFGFRGVLCSRVFIFWRPFGIPLPHDAYPTLWVTSGSQRNRGWGPKMKGSSLADAERITKRIGLA